MTASVRKEDQNTSKVKKKLFIRTKHMYIFGVIPSSGWFHPVVSSPLFNCCLHAILWLDNWDFPEKNVYLKNIFYCLTVKHCFVAW